MTSNTQNKIYYNKKIKKYNIEIAKHVNRLFNKNDHISLLDLGCGNAGLIFMLTKKFKNLKSTGVDVDEKLIKFCKKNAKELKIDHRITFINKNFSNFETQKKFNLIVCSGFLCFYQDFRTPLKKILKLTRNKESKIILFGDFNSHAVNKVVKYQDVSKYNNNQKWLEGFTSFSIKTIKEYVVKKNYKLVSYKFNLNQNIGNKNDDPIRSISRILNNFGRIIFNKANLIFDFHTLIISKK